MLAGGGSGGHVYPLIAVAEELRRQSTESGQNVKIRFIGDGEIMAETAREINMPFRRVFAPKWRRYFSIYNFLDLLKIPIGVVQAFFHVWIFMPDVMLVKGGYASFLPALAAKLMAIPLVVHESDSVPGKVNLWWGKMSRRVFVSFEHARGYFRADRTEVIGNPIRSIITVPIDREQALSVFEFPFGREKPVIFINGGSQGAQAINEVVVTNLVEFVKKFFIIHQCGAKNIVEINAQVARIEQEEEKTYAAEIRRSYRSIGQLTSQQMAQAYAAADVIVSRAGSALFEIAAVGKPAIVIPLPQSANDHQIKNAEEFAHHGAIMVDQDNLTPHILINDILRTYEDRERLGRAIQGFARPDAAVRIAQELLAASR